MRDSYCSLCEDCPLGRQDFLDTLIQMKEFIDQIRDNYWSHCCAAEPEFDVREFRKGLEWFLKHTECPGCKAGRGLADCPIRQCAQQRHLEHCYQCPDLNTCTKVEVLLGQFPDLKNLLRRRQLKFRAREYHKKQNA